MKIITEVGETNDIPTLLYYEENAVNLPLVMIVHGFNNDKYEGSKLALRLAEVGFAVLCFDIDRHGSRYDGFIETIDSDVAFGTELFKVIENTHTDIEGLLVAFSDDERLDVTRLGMVGYSIGANIVNYELSRIDNLKASISILGSPNFVDLLVYNMEKDSVSEFTTEGEKSLLSYVESLDPRSMISNSNMSVPWLMINGSKDDNIPAEFSAEFYDEVKEMYKGDIEFIVEDEYHFISDDMLGKSIEWLMKYMI